MADVQDAAAPAGPEELTSEWFNNALHAGGILTQATVASVGVTPLGPGQGLIGRLFRVEITYEPEETGAPRSVIAKLAASPGATRNLASRFRMYEREARFYQELASEAGLPTPCVYYSAASPDGNAVLLLQDMAPARAGDLLAGCTLGQMATLLPAVARMHAKWWDSAELNGLTWLPLPNDPVALQIAGDISERAWEHFIANFGKHLPPRLRALGDRLRNDTSVLDRLSAPPRTLVHADLRLNNLMFAGPVGSELVAVLDWQSTVRARAPMDIARLFVNNLQPEDRRLAERDLLPEYHRTLERQGVRDYSYEECWTDYRLALINQFGQVVVLSSLLDIDARQDENVGPETGTRLVVALLDFELLELMPRPPLISRLVARIKRLAGRSP